MQLTNVFLVAICSSNCTLYEIYTSGADKLCWHLEMRLNLANKVVI